MNQALADYPNEGVYLLINCLGMDDLKDFIHKNPKMITSFHVFGVALHGEEHFYVKGTPYGCHCPFPVVADRDHNVLECWYQPDGDTETWIKKAIDGK